MSLNQQLLQRTDAIILRPQPRQRKPRSQEIKVVLSSGPLTIIQVKTVKGDYAYQFKARSRKYAYRKDLTKLLGTVAKIIYPVIKAKSREYKRKYNHSSKGKATAKRYYQIHIKELRAKHREYQRQYRARIRASKKRNFTT